MELQFANNPFVTESVNKDAIKKQLTKVKGFQKKVQKILQLPMLHLWQ